MRLRVLDGANRHRARQVRPQRLHLRQHERRHRQLRPRAVLAGPRAAQRRCRRDAGEGPVGRREGHAPRPAPVNGQPNPLNGQTAGMLVKVEELTGDLVRVRLFHTSVSRAIATWPTWGGEPGFTGSFEEYLAQTFPTSTAADFAILEAGVTSEDTYVEQGLYWATGHVPMLKYVANTYKPDLLLVGMPTTDEFQHQFLGLVSPKLPAARANPAYDDVYLDGVKDNRVAAARGVHPDRLPGGGRGPDARPVAARQEPHDVRRVRPRLRAAVPRDRREQAARRSRPPARRPQLSNCRITLPNPLPELDPHHRELREGEGVLGGRRAAGLPERRWPRPRPAPANARNPNFAAARTRTSCPTRACRRPGRRVVDRSRRRSSR